MKFIYFLYLLFLINTFTFAQSVFVGKLVYSVVHSDSTLSHLFPPTLKTIYTNDTILRIETQTENLGDQVLIRHLEKKKEYLLISNHAGKFAIQVPENKVETNKYEYKKIRGKKKIKGLKSKKLKVSIKDVSETFFFYYSKSISAKLLPGFENFPGLLTDYYMYSTDGMYHCQLIDIEYACVSKDLFGIPSDFQKISMSDFVELMIGYKK